MPPLASEALDRCPCIRLDARVGRLIDLRPVVPVGVALRRPGGAPEVVERDRSVPALGEPECELLVEAVKPPHIREDHHTRCSRTVGQCEECGEAVAIGGCEDEIVV